MKIKKNINKKKIIIVHKKYLRAIFYKKKKWLKEI
jgi:hypothetical protein